MINSGGFPVKMQIPLSFSVKANITISFFNFIDNNDNNYKLFEIPRFTFFK